MVNTELIREEPVESRFTYGDWMARIYPCNNVIGWYILLILLNPKGFTTDWCYTDMNDESYWMKYKFKSFEEAYEWLLSFLDKVNAPKWKSE